jgi:hypothetical protein
MNHFGFLKQVDDVSSIKYWIQQETQHLKLTKPTVSTNPNIPFRKPMLTKRRRPKTNALFHGWKKPETIATKELPMFWNWFVKKTVKKE